MAAEADLATDFGTDDLPGVAETQPLVGDLALPAIDDGLVEDAKLVADAIADGGHFDGGKRVHVAGGEPSESAIAETGFLLLIEDFIQITTQSRERLAGGFGDAEVEQIVAEMRTGEKLGREIGHAASVVGANVFQTGHRVVEHPVADGQCQGEIQVVRRSDPAGAAKGAAEVFEERLFDFIHREAGAGFRHLFHVTNLAAAARHVNACALMQKKPRPAMGAVF